MFCFICGKREGDEEGQREQEWERERGQRDGVLASFKCQPEAALSHLRKISTERSPKSECPVGISLGGYLVCSLMLAMQC